MASMTNAEFDRLLYLCHVDRRREVINGLLAGNDTQCFTTRQYRAQMFKAILALATNPNRQELLDHFDGLARKQLAAEGLREVKPDVWTKEQAQ